MSSTGFPKPVSVNDAFQKLEILSKRYPPQSETISVSSLMPGMVLAEDIKAIEDIPSLTKSTVGGFAIIVEQLGTKRQIVGLSTAETPYNAIIHNGECVRITNGGVVPEGADTVVPFENVSLSSDKKSIEILFQSKKGDNIRQRGSEAKYGDLLLRTGSIIDPVSIGILHILGISQIEIYEKPSVCIVSVGIENRSQRSRENENRLQLMQLLHRKGFIPIDAGESSSDQIEIEKSIRKAAEFACFIIVCGENVNLYGMIEKLGLEVDIAGIISNPGDFTFAHGMIDQKPVFLFILPQDPVSVWIGVNLFFNPFLRAIGGGSFESRIRWKSETTIPIKPSPETIFIPAKTVIMNGKVVSIPLPSNELCAANSILEISKDKSYNTGDTINMIITD